MTIEFVTCFLLIYILLFYLFLFISLNKFIKIVQIKLNLFKKNFILNKLIIKNLL